MQARNRVGIFHLIVLKVREDFTWQIRQGRGVGVVARASTRYPTREAAGEAGADALERLRDTTERSQS